MAHAALSGGGTCWDSMNVRKVWKAVEPDDVQRGTFVFEDETGRLFDEFGTAPVGSLPSPILLIEFPGDSRERAKRSARQAKGRSAKV